MRADRFFASFDKPVKFNGWLAYGDDMEPVILFNTAGAKRHIARERARRFVLRWRKKLLRFAGNPV